MRRFVALSLLSTLAVACKSSGGGNANLSPAADAKVAKPAAVTAAAVALSHK